MHVCLCGRLCYGDLGKVSSRGINCRIPRTSKRRGADSKKRAREHCCFGSLTGFLSAIFFFSFFLFSHQHGKGENKNTHKGPFEPFSLDVWIYKIALVKLFGTDACSDRANIKRLSLLLLGIHTSDVNTTALSGCKQEGSYISQFKDL